MSRTPPTAVSRYASILLVRFARRARAHFHACAALAMLAGCSADTLVEPLVDDGTEAARVAAAGRVTDLVVAAATDSSTMLSWTEVADGTGGPASYEVRYSPEPIDWSTASPGCDGVLRGARVGARMTCTVTGLAPASGYDFQLVSYGLTDPGVEEAPRSNVAHGETSEPPVESGPRPGGVWIGRDEIAALPTWGAAWDNLTGAASRDCGSVALADQNQSNNVCIMAKALVHARTGVEAYASEVAAAIGQIVDARPYSGRALALGRELGAYVIAADLIDLARHDPQLDGAFRKRLRSLLTTRTGQGPANLVECHERRPNNWGTMCGGSRAAIAAYLEDEAELARVAQVFKGWLGDRSAYDDFEYGDLSWQCDPARPVGINPVGCRRDGHDVDGVIPDDQRRGGSYRWPAPRESYVWESLQGAVMQAVILERAGYAAFEWESQALRRAAQWLHGRVDYPAEGDDTWQPHVFNHYYGTSFAAPSPSKPGKNVGWTDWTHGR